MYLCGIPRDAPDPRALLEPRFDELRMLTAYERTWRAWICERLAEAGRSAEPGDPDLALARAAWRWLEETELLAADLDAIGPAPWNASGDPPGDQEVRVWTPAWQLGLPLGHLAVHLC